MKTTDQIISDYKAAFLHANGHPVVVEHANGWFSLRGSKYRRAEILKMTMGLLARPAWTPILGRFNCAGRYIMPKDNLK